MRIRDWISKITFTSVSLAAIVMIILLQVLFFLLGFAIPGLAAYKFGPAFYMMAAGAALYFIIKFVGKRDNIDRRDFLYLILVLGAIIAFFVLTKKYIPEMFSLSVPSQFQGTDIFQFTKP